MDIGLIIRKQRKIDGKVIIKLLQYSGIQKLWNLQTKAGERNV